jgi:hypothetical protein
MRGIALATGLELYEALKPTVGEEAARVIAEALPMTDRVATNSDIDAAVERLEARLDARLGTFEARLFRWILGFFATLWIAMTGMIVAIVTKL